MRLLIAVALIASCAAPSIAIAADDPVPRTVRGVVVDEHDQPAAKVGVTLKWFPDGKASVETAADGSFELTAPEIASRGRTIRASADDGARQGQARLPWEPAKNSDQPLRPKLSPARRIQLHVVDAAGKPVKDAVAGVIAGFSEVESTPTDAAGNATFLLPSDLEVDDVFASAAGHGFDYHAYVLRRGEQGDKRAKRPQPPTEPITLTLAGAAPVTVTVTENGGGPLADVGVYPWLLTKPGEADSLNLSFCLQLVQATTDADGKATFPWMPAWQQTGVTFWPTSKEFVHARCNYDPKTGGGQLAVALDRFVPISGTATLPDGAPAAGVPIEVRGSGYGHNDFQVSTITDANGKYEIKAAPNMVYLMVAGNNEWSAAPHTGFAVMPKQPLTDLNFELRKATRVHGRATIGPEEKPLAEQAIEIYQYGVSANEMKDVALPNPAHDNFVVQPLHVIRTTTDAKGQYELFVGDGDFDIRGPQQAANVEKFSIDGDAAKEFNFHSDRPENGPLRGLVDAEDPTAAAGAKITGIYRHELAGQDLIATADAAGKFEVERELHPVVLHAESADGKLAGLVEIGPDDKVAAITLRPTATAVGRLVDKKTGKPLAGREVQYGTTVHMGDDNAPFRTAFGQTVKTDDEGRFRTGPLILEVKYLLSVVVRPQDEPAQMSWHGIGEVNATQAKEIDLGDVKFELAPPLFDNVKPAAPPKG